ncbi:MAG: hypothetical protein IJM30_13150 [Thermoguttaceae bacterium]|nr:hypothetical protein [Thermoguttaceae bacterium]
MRKLLPVLSAILFALAATVSLADEPFSVDFSQRVGQIKKLNGANLWAPTHNSRNSKNQEEAVACNMSTMRLHDAPLDNPGMRLVDVQHIFGVETADPKDPANYYFDQTDDYIKRIVDAGVEPIYRLGTSIEHSANNYYAKNPKNPEKFAEICAGIVRHYNAGWANGFEWNIRYWEIWNEPDLVPQMWDDKDWNSYLKFYVIVAKRLRSEFPDIKIGGPAITWANVEKIRALAAICKEEGAPLDFVSWHCYPKTPSELLDPPAKLRKTLDEAGFPKTELHLNEWHYLPCGFPGIQGDLETKVHWYEAPEGMHGYVSAAFNDFVLTRWQDTPLDMSNYYCYNSHHWGVHDFYGRRRVTYYSLLLFGELVKNSPERVKTNDGNGSVALLGGVDANGDSKRLLVSIFQREETTPVVVALKGVPESGKVKVARIDADGFAETEIEYANGKLSLDPKDSGVYLVRF